jgi:mRNA-degrading endonuclease toxin of MazEF toxin-antitoxin module
VYLPQARSPEGDRFPLVHISEGPSFGVSIMKVYNKETMLVLPTTGRAKHDKFHAPLEIESWNKLTNEITTRTVYVKLTQVRVISNKRLIRKVGVIEEEKFLNIQKEFRKFT